MHATDNPSAFRDLPFMGVIRVNVEAMKIGYRMGDPAWSNLGQGQPEVGMIDGAPPRIDSMPIEAADHAYGPVEGIPELREAVADYMNRLYREGKPSQYTAENVAIAPGGRAALTRIGAALAHQRLGYFTPDYTAYEDLLTTFSGVDPVWIELEPSTGFRIEPDALERRVTDERLGALLISNPCNPTGTVVWGDELREWVRLARERSCTLLMDEFYSHYFYANGAQGPVSSAAYVEDVDEDPVVIVDGLTKSFRYPGWRMGWVVAPKKVIQTLTAAGSFLDGGPCRPIQKAALRALEPDQADRETSATRAVFAEKQRLTLDALKAMGVTFARDPEGTFYAFGSVADLPSPLNTGIGFMRAAFLHNVLTVPGEFFDVNPHRRRPAPSPLEQTVRFSFGPPKDNLEAGLGRLAEMVASHQ
ncbi:MAG: pyridoxal phosphate-dependent aminotransferase [Chthonomonadaceae bacterium]|nr:pyridoxal phosphate-dependent aminotransferase [Chthonomonadaceae bacterium]